MTSLVYSVEFYSSTGLTRSIDAMCNNFDWMIHLHSSSATIQLHPGINDLLHRWSIEYATTRIRNRCIGQPMHVEHGNWLLWLTWAIQQCTSNRGDACEH